MPTTVHSIALGGASGAATTCRSAHPASATPARPVVTTTRANLRPKPAANREEGPQVGVGFANLRPKPAATRERSEERRVGNAWVSTGRTRWAPEHYKRKQHHGV